MKWYKSIFYKDPNKKAAKNMPKKMPKNIYNDKNIDVHVKKFHVVHYVFKYKYFMPLIKLGKKLIGKALIKKIPKENHNRNIIIFDKAFEEAIKKWHLLYLRNSGDPSKRPSYKEMIRRSKDPKNNSGQTLRDMKEFIVTMYLYDTAYREFMNILMHEIAQGMVNYYKDHPDKSTGHLFFTTDMYEVNYFVLEKMVEYRTQLGIHAVSQEYNDAKAKEEVENERRKQERNSDEISKN